MNRPQKSVAQPWVVSGSRVEVPPVVPTRSSGMAAAAPPEPGPAGASAGEPDEQAASPATRQAVAAAASAGARTTRLRSFISLRRSLMSVLFRSLDKRGSGGARSRGLDAERERAVPEPRVEVRPGELARHGGDRVGDEEPGVGLVLPQPLEELGVDREALRRAGGRDPLCG